MFSYFMQMLILLHLYIPKGLSHDLGVFLNIKSLNLEMEIRYMLPGVRVANRACPFLPRNTALLLFLCFYKQGVHSLNEDTLQWKCKLVFFRQTPWKLFSYSEFCLLELQDYECLLKQNIYPLFIHLDLFIIHPSLPWSSRVPFAHKSYDSVFLHLRNLFSSFLLHLLATYSSIFSTSHFSAITEERILWQNEKQKEEGIEEVLTVCKLAMYKNYWKSYLQQENICNNLSIPLIHKFLEHLYFFLLLLSLLS